jgi:hypothetical protein
MSRVRLSVLFGFTALSVLLAGLVVLTPRTAEAAYYQAGVLRPGTMICKCPIMTGDCVCEWTEY